jgi:hypothetical protein
MKPSFSFGGDGCPPHNHIDTRTSGKWVTCTATDQRSVILGYDDDIGLVQIDLASGRVTGRYQREIRDSVRAISFLPGTDALLVACADGKLMGFDVEDQSHLRTVHHSNKNWSRLIPVSKSLCVAVDDIGTLHAIDPRTLEVMSELEGRGFVDCHAVDSVSGTLWCAGRSSSIGVYSWDSNRLLRTQWIDFESEYAHAFTGLHYCQRRSALFVLSERGMVTAMRRQADGHMSSGEEFTLDDWCYFLRATDRDIAFTTRGSGALVVRKDSVLNEKLGGIRRPDNRSEGRVEISERYLFHVDDESGYMMVCVTDPSSQSEDLRLFHVGHADFTSLEWTEFGLIACANTDDVWLVPKQSLEGL